jgi:hypothetical protein
MVRYPFDVLRAVSQVEPLTTNGNSDSYSMFQAFDLRYRRVNATFCEAINSRKHKKPHFLLWYFGAFMIVFSVYKFPLSMPC